MFSESSRRAYSSACVVIDIVIFIVVLCVNASGRRLALLPQTQRLPATNATLSPYTESDGGPRYYRGTCDTLLSLNTSEGSYNFSVEILPGHGPVSLGSTLVGQL